MSIIREMRESDREEILNMMRVFYTSPAVLSNGSEEIFNADIDYCVNDSPYLEGYVFEQGGEAVGVRCVRRGKKCGDRRSAR